MRLFRVLFWFSALYHLFLGLWLGAAPDVARSIFHYPETSPLFLLQIEGLLYFLIALGLAYVAERPAKGIAITCLASLASMMVPAFTAIAWYRGEVNGFAASYHAISSLIWLPLFLSYIFWFYHIPRPSEFLADMGVFGRKR